MRVKGRVVAFDPRTGWGEAVYDLTVVRFHMTSYHSGPPALGHRVEIVFNDSGGLISLQPSRSR